MTRDEIAALIPHAGAMCLLDSVISWDTTSITCVSARHLAPEHPLRRVDGHLGALTGIELAGQAAALHGRLTAPTSDKPRFGYLASLRDIRIATAILDAPSALTITAERLTGDAAGATYNFALTQDAVLLLSGRFTVLFGPAA